MNDNSIESYLNGIQRAHDEGLIEYASHYVPEAGIMKFSNHVPWEIDGVKYQGCLSLTNTRPLCYIAKLVLNFFQNDAIRFLELGPGAGNACYDLFYFAKEKGETVEISTVSYTPINPYMPILLSGEQLLDVLSRNKNLRFIAEGPQGPLWYILTEEVFCTQNEEGIQIFGMLDKPYINYQYIGNYPQNIDLGAVKFDLIYDMLGPLHGKDLEPINDACSHLTDRGILFFLFDTRYTPGKILIEGAKKGNTGIFDDSDSVIIDIETCSAIVAKKGSELSASLRKKWDPKKQTLHTYDTAGLLLSLLS
ncbi:MAG: hypothetical protein H8D67_04790 [Deltaproteobacteria bacterium]|nr:hypothetical protein [Deltaproteobacteria bacterium]